MSDKVDKMNGHKLQPPAQPQVQSQVEAAPDPYIVETMQMLGQVAQQVAEGKVQAMGITCITSDGVTRAFNFRGSTGLMLVAASYMLADEVKEGVIKMGVQHGVAQREADAKTGTNSATSNPPPTVEEPGPA